jgi:DNA-directed RNA polymerase subunit RPC12/RpoP
MTNKNKYFKIVGSTLIACTFLFLAFGSDDSKSSSGSSNSSNSNASHICSTCGKKYEGNGYAPLSDGVGGDLHLEKGDPQYGVCIDCEDCAQKAMDRMNKARRHKGYQGN